MGSISPVAGGGYARFGNLDRQGLMAMLTAFMRMGVAGDKPGE